MEFMLLTERTPEGDSFSVCEEATGKVVVSLNFRKIICDMAVYELQTHFGSLELTIIKPGHLLAELDRIGKINILRLKDDTKSGNSEIYFLDNSKIIVSKFEKAKLVCEDDGNYLFIQKWDGLGKPNMHYVTHDGVTKIRKFQVWNDDEFIVGNEELKKYNIEKLNITNDGEHTKIYAKDANNKDLIFDLKLNLLNKEKENEKI